MESAIRPELMDTYVIGGVRKYDINIDVVFDNGLYKWEQVSIPYGRFDYSGVVDALVQYKYPIDKMQAVINNYLLEPENEEFVTVFNEMQVWRKEAKEIAKEALLYGLR